MLRKPRALPKTRARADLLLQPTVSEIIAREKETNSKEKEQLLRMLKKRKKCEDCSHWKEYNYVTAEYDPHCGLYSCACASSSLRPRFLAKGEAG